MHTQRRVSFNKICCFAESFWTKNIFLEGKGGGGGGGLSSLNISNSLLWPRLGGGGGGC